MGKCSTRSTSRDGPASPSDEATWELEKTLAAHLEKIWDQPDEGIWEVRGGRKYFTHSKVMAWVAFDRAVRSAEEFGLDGPLDALAPRSRLSFIGRFAIAGLTWV